jgi:hypothetical protein
MDERTAVKILQGINDDTRREITASICKLLIENGLSFRQAEALLDYAKDRLKDARMA